MTKSERNAHRRANDRKWVFEPSVPARTKMEAERSPLWQVVIHPSDAPSCHKNRFEELVPTGC